MHSLYHINNLNSRIGFLNNIATAKRSYSFVFDKANQSNLVYADSKYDISSSVLKEMGLSAD